MPQRTEKVYTRKPNNPYKVKYAETFFDIWSKHSSYGKIKKKNGFGKSWKTSNFKGNRDKNYNMPTSDGQYGFRVYPYVTRRELEVGWLSDKYQVGKRFSKWTNYFMLDIDRAESIYHPDRNLTDFYKLVASLADIGLTDFITVRSSHSEGIHLYFPLKESVKSWGLANRVTKHLKANDFIIQSGQLELFPNCKRTRDALYQGHRLPLQPESGSFILNDEFEPVSNSTFDFVERWNACSNQLKFADNGLEKWELGFEEENNNVEVGENGIPKGIRFTRRGQTNDVLRNLTNYAGNVLNYDTVGEIAGWVNATIVKVPGFAEFSSEDSQLKLEKGWAAAWAKSHLKMKRHAYIAQGEKYHAAKRQYSLEKLSRTMDALADQTFEYVTHAVKALIAKAKELFGEGFSNIWLMKNRDLWENELVMATTTKEHTHTQLVQSVDIEEPNDTNGSSQTFNSVINPADDSKVSTNAHSNEMVGSISSSNFTNRVVNQIENLYFGSEVRLE
jgi:hypothetical protein